MSFKDKYAIVGLGVTEQGKLPGVTMQGIRSKAVMLAVEDAGLKMDDIEGDIYQNDGPAFGMVGDVPRMVGMTPKFIWGIQSGGGSTVAAISAAVGAIEVGMANYVVCSFGYTGAQAGQMVGAVGPGARSTSSAFGQFGPGADHAYAAMRHMHEFGTTSRQLGAIAVHQREMAQQHPDAYTYGRPMTIEDHQNARIIAWPLRMYDFCLVTDGGIAVVITTAKRAKALKRPPVYIMGIGAGHQIRQFYGKTNYTALGIAESKEAAFRTAGIGLDDIDVAELYDCFTITVLLEIEGYGFCKRGEGGPFVEAGNIKLDGKIPINTRGGNLSWGYTEGWTPLAEGVRQLRGEGGPTQVKDAEIALVSGHGGTGSGSMQYCHGSLILRR